MTKKTYTPQIQYKSVNGTYIKWLDPIKFLVPTADLVGFTEPKPGRIQFDFSQYWTLDKLDTHPHAFLVQSGVPVEIHFEGPAFLEYYSFILKRFAGCSSCGSRKATKEFLITFF